MEELTRLFTNVYATYDVLKNQILRVGVPQEVFGVANRFEAHLQELKDFTEAHLTPAVSEAEHVVNEAAGAVEEATETPAEEGTETTISEPSDNGSQEETQDS